MSCRSRSSNSLASAGWGCQRVPPSHGWSIIFAILKKMAINTYLMAINTYWKWTLFPYVQIKDHPSLIFLRLGDLKKSEDWNCWNHPIQVTQAIAHALQCQNHGANGGAAWRPQKARFFFWEIFEHLKLAIPGMLWSKVLWCFVSIQFYTFFFFLWDIRFGDKHWDNNI